jgi:hypothetical protein
MLCIKHIINYRFQEELQAKSSSSCIAYALKQAAQTEQVSPAHAQGLSQFPGNLAGLQSFHPMLPDGEV